jgi:hypothetical protein
MRHDRMGDVSDFDGAGQVIAKPLRHHGSGCDGVFLIVETGL